MRTKPPRNSFSGRRWIVVAAVIVAMLPASGFADTTLISAGATWKYLDNGSNQGTAWRENGFNDGSWASGSAELGYGDGDEATVVSYGPDPNNKYITTYFRRSFNVTNPSAYGALRLRIVRDDGAVVYINGIEVYRTNMPGGTITYTTTASSAVGGGDESAWHEPLVNSMVLQTGTNVVAVEIHQVNGTSSDISFNLELIGLTSGPSVSIRKGPYLIFPGDNTEMQVLWQFWGSAPCVLEWGEDTNYSDGMVHTTEYGSDHQHTHTIANLTPGTKYYYRMNGGGQSYTGSFKAAPASSAENVKILAYGDTRTKPWDHNSVCGAMISHYTNDPGFQTLLLLTGDWVANGDSEGDWDGQYFNRNYANLPGLQKEIAVNGAMGNHEVPPGNLYYKYWPYPYVAGRHWSFDYGPVHVVVVNNYESFQPGTRQGDWLAADLAGSNKQWKIVELHEPGWSAGGGHGNNQGVQLYLQPLCVQYGVQLVLAGHNHYYSRFEVDGVTHITTGGGGAPLVNPNYGTPGLIAAESTYHFCAIDIQGDDLYFKAIRTNATIIDQFSIYEGPPPPTDTPGPTSTPEPTPLPVPVLVNPSFEASLGTEWQKWVGSGSNQDNNERDYEGANAPDGVWVLAVKGIGSGGKGAYQYVSAGWIDGNDYRATVWVKNLSNTNINYSIGYKLGSGGSDGSTATYGSTVVHPATWTQASVEFTYTGSSGATVYLRAVNDGHSERAGFDHVEIVNLGPSGPAASPTPTSPPGNTATFTATPTAAPTPDTTPVVLNPSFEASLGTEWQKWVGSGSSQDNNERDYVGGTAPDGVWVLAIKGIGSGGKGAYQYISGGWIDGHDYRATVWAKNLANTNINYSIGYKLGNGGSDGSTATYGSTVVHPSSWTQASVEFTYSGSSGATIYLRAVNDGHSERAGFDLVEIEDLGSSGPAATPTATSLPGNTATFTATPTAAPTPDTTPVVTNPSFEVSLGTEWQKWVGSGSNQDNNERDYLGGSAPDGVWVLAVKGIGIGGKGAYQYISDGWIDGHDYRVTVWVKNLANTNINYSVGYKLGNGGSGGSTATYGSTVVHPSSWTQASVEFTYSGSSGATIYLRVVNDGHSERAGFDLVEIEDIEMFGMGPVPSRERVGFMFPPDDLDPVSVAFRRISSGI